MVTYTVTQKLISLGAKYLVRTGESKDVIMTVKGRILSFTPKLEAIEGEDGSPVARMTGNLFKTKFEIFDNSDKVTATISFPFMAFVKRFTLTADGKTYQAKGGLIARKFSCLDESGKEVLTISKDFSFRDKFTINMDESFPKGSGILAAVAIDQRFFQDR